MCSKTNLKGIIEFVMFCNFIFSLNVSCEIFTYFYILARFLPINGRIIFCSFTCSCRCFQWVSFLGFQGSDIETPVVILDFMIISLFCLLGSFSV